MKRTIVQYKVKPDQAGANEALVRAVYEELHETQPAGLRYATFKQADGVSFVHVASIDTDDGSNPLQGVRAFKAFQKGIAGRCDEAPVVTDLEEVASYEPARATGGS